MSYRFLIALVSVWGVAASAAPAKFDLACQGTKTTVTFGQADRVEPYSYRYIVDLSSGAYCKQAAGAVSCDTSGLIDSSTPSTITFYRARAGLGYSVDEVSRESGSSHWNGIGVGGNYESVDGKCAVAPFSGFPKTRF